MGVLNNFTKKSADIIFGSALDASMGEALRVTLVATGLDEDSPDAPAVTADEPRAPVVNVGQPAAGPAEPPAIRQSAQDEPKSSPRIPTIPRFLQGKN